MLRWSRWWIHKVLRGGTWWQNLPGCESDGRKSCFWTSSHHIWDTRSPEQLGNATIYSPRGGRVCCCSEGHTLLLLLPPPHAPRQDIPVQWSSDSLTWGLWKRQKKKSSAQSVTADASANWETVTQTKPRKDGKYEDVSRRDVVGGWFIICSPTPFVSWADAVAMTMRNLMGSTWGQIIHDIQNEQSSLFSLKTGLVVMYRIRRGNEIQHTLSTQKTLIKHVASVHWIPRCFTFSFLLDCRANN